MGIIGMTNTERQILVNQAAIMGFLHGSFLDKVTEHNQESYNVLYACYLVTKGMLDMDDRLKTCYSNGLDNLQTSE